jgi:hypothetical protein
MTNQTLNKHERNVKEMGTLSVIQTVRATIDSDIRLIGKNQEKWV